MWLIALLMAAARTAVATNYVTELNVSIDRCASAWLIQRFIDSAPTFEYIQPGTRPPPGVTFGFFGATYFNRGTDCTFTALVKSHQLSAQESLQRMNSVVNDALSWQQGAQSLPVTLRQQIIRIRRLLNDDARTVEELMTTMDLLYATSGGRQDRILEAIRPSFDLLEVRLLARGLREAGQKRVAEHISTLSVERLPLSAADAASWLGVSVTEGFPGHRGPVSVFDDLARVLEGEGRAVSSATADWVAMVSAAGLQRPACVELFPWLAGRTNLSAGRGVLVQADQLVWEAARHNDVP